jgi:hypothetical protein
MRSRNRVAALAKGAAIACVLRLVVKPHVNAETGNIISKQYQPPFEPCRSPSASASYLSVSRKILFNL